MLEEGRGGERIERGLERGCNRFYRSNRYYRFYRWIGYDIIVGGRI